MQTCIALFRGINVGGKNLLPMKELVTILESLDCHNVKTYIQSGNAVFRCRKSAFAKLAGKIADAIHARFGFTPAIHLLHAQELKQTISQNPFPEAVSEPKTLHAGFLESRPAHPDLEAMEKLKTQSERFALKERVFYLHAPDGIGKSKLATRAENLLGVSMTVRNWRTVEKLAEMIDL
ncbi:MAG: DUF1697 domain-containing protein [Chitinivibrionales bacterium]|nr:DUF1697 domain-containing protein [Chitinivibrionales bacterium]